MDSRQYGGGGNWLKAAMLVGKEVTVQIREVFETTTRDVPPKKKLAVRFANSDKQLQLNRGNQSALENAFGFDTDAWVGKNVKLSHDPTVQLRGVAVGGIRLTVIK